MNRTKDGWVLLELLIEYVELLIESVNSRGSIKIRIPHYCSKTSVLCNSINMPCILSYLRRMLERAKESQRERVIM